MQNIHTSWGHGNTCFPHLDFKVQYIEHLDVRGGLCNILLSWCSTQVIQRLPSLTFPAHFNICHLSAVTHKIKCYQNTNYAYLLNTFTSTCCNTCLAILRSNFLSVCMVTWMKTTSHKNKKSCISYLLHHICVVIHRYSA